MYVCVFITTSIPQLNKHMIILSNNYIYIYIPYMYTYIEKYLYTLYLHSVHTRFTTKEASYIFTQTLSPPPFHSHKHTHPPFR